MREFINIVEQAAETHPVPEEIREKYSCGLCGHLATYINQTLGWPIMVSFHSDYDAIAHAWNVTPSGKDFDIYGVHKNGMDLVERDPQPMTAEELKGRIYNKYFDQQMKEAAEDFETYVKPMIEGGV